MRHIKVLSIAFLFVMANQIVTLAQSTNVSSETFTKQADRCNRILRESILSFYSPDCLDAKNGGYFESLDANGKFTAEEEKFLTLQARQIWFFSNMSVNQIERSNVNGAPTYTNKAMALQGYALLDTQFRDKEAGGYFLKIKTKGEPSDVHKHVYPLSFVIYGLVELHRATDDDQYLKQAIEIFELLEKNCHDKTNRGYLEFFERDWQVVTDPNQWGVVGPVGFKTYNSHLHLLEAFTQLYLETKDETVGKRLDELVKICMKKVRHNEFGSNVDLWTNDWKMVETEKNLRASYGHDLECAWLVLKAVDALENRTREHEGWAIKLCDQAIKFGHDENHGGFFYTGPLGKPGDDRIKEWWTQSEALVGLLTCYQISNNEKYLKLFNETLNFVETYHVADQGGWYGSLKEDGSLGDNKSRTSMWHGTYHNGRALMMCETMLRELAKQIN